LPAWQIALPVIACLAAGGSLEDGITLASAWISLYIASDILDNVEDKELIPDRFLISLRSRIESCDKPYIAALIS